METDSNQGQDSAPILRWLQTRKQDAAPWLGMATGLAALGGLLIVLQAWFIANAVDQVLFHQAKLGDIGSWLWPLPLIFLARAAQVWGVDILSFKAAAQVRLKLREELFEKLRHLGPIRLHQMQKASQADDPEAHQNGTQAAGDLANTLSDGVESLEGYYARYLPAVSLMTVLPLILLVFIFPADTLSGITMMITAPLIPFFMVLIGKGAEALNQKQWRQMARMSAHFLDVIQGLTTLKQYNASRREAEVIARISDRFRQSTMRVLRLAFLSSAVLEFFATVSIALVAVFIGFKLLAGDMLFLYGFFVLLLAPEFYLPLRNMGTQYHARMEAVGAAERMMDLLDRETEESSHGSGMLPVSNELGLEFENVSLYYDADRSSHPAVDKLNLTIEPGETLAVVGESGAGKSSLANLLLGFLPPSNGRVLAHTGSKTGRHHPCDLAQLDLNKWRSRITWVPQNPRLFQGSIADNIRLGVPEASMQSVRAAARAAYADEFIRTLPQGYDTPIRETGNELSGGQVQRIALARAFLRDTPLLILDEPTASLDADSEVLVNAAIAQLCRSRTVLIIAHRLHTLTHADRILVMQDGQAVELGEEEELRSRNGPYARLVNAWEGSPDDTGPDDTGPGTHAAGAGS